LRESMAASAPAAPSADLASRDGQPGNGRLCRRASLPLYDGLLARGAAAARLRALLPSRRGKVRLRGLSRAARLLRALLRGGDRCDRPPGGGAAPALALPQG